MSDKVHRKIRLPGELVDLLRDLRDSHITPRPIPELVNACLKQTRGVVCNEKSLPTTRAGSVPIDLWLNPEFADVEPDEIRARVALALEGIEEKLIPDNIKMNRSGEKWQP